MADDRIRIVIEGDGSDLRAALVGAAADLKLFDKQVKHSGDQQVKLSKDVDTVAKSFRGAHGEVFRLNQGFTILRNTVGVIKWPALIAGAGLATKAVVGLGAGVVSLTSSVSASAGVLGAYPAVLSAVGQDMGVLKLATSDLTEAYKGNAKALERLTPEAKQFLGTLKSYKPQIDALRKSAQRGLFSGLEDGLKSAAKNADVLDRIVARTSRTLGSLGRDAGKRIGGKQFGQDLERIGKSNDLITARLGRGAMELTDALRQMLVAGGPTFDALALDAERFAHSLDMAAKAARGDGSMAAFFKESRREFKDLVELAGNLGHVLINIGHAAKPSGDSLIGSLIETTQKWEDFTSSQKGQHALRKFFDDAEPVVRETAGLVADISAALTRVGTSPGGAGLIHQLREAVPELEKLLSSTTDAFGPALIDALVAASKILGDLAGSSGPLVLFTEGITTAAEGIHWMLTEIPGLKPLVVSLAAGASIYKALQIGASLTGLKRIKEMLGSGGLFAGGLGKGGKGGGVGGVFTGSVGTAANPAYVIVVDGPGGVTPVGGPGGKGPAGERTPRRVSVARGLRRGAAGALGAYVTHETIRGAGGGQVLSSAASGAVGGGLTFGIPGALVGLGAGTLAGVAQAQYGKYASEAKKYEAITKALGLTRKEMEQVRLAAGRMSEGLGAVRTDKLVQLRNALQGTDWNTSGAQRNVAALTDKVDHELGTRLTAAVRKAWRAAGRDTDRSMSDIQRTVDRQMKRVNTAMELDSAAGAAAIKANFEGAISVVQSQMAAGTTSVQQGMSAIQGFLSQELKALGVQVFWKSPSVAGLGTLPQPKPATGGSKYVLAPNAKGALYQLGKPGEAGTDSIPMNLGGIGVIAAPGEQIAVINRHQQAALNDSLAQTHGTDLQGLFRQVDTPNYMARGGIPKQTMRKGLGAVTTIGQGVLDKGRDAAQARLDKEAQKAVGASGGTAGLAGQVLRAIAWARAHGWHGSVTSGVRSRAKQQYLWDNAPALGLVRGVSVAAPGTSMHERGLAIDVSDWPAFLRAMESAPANAKLLWRGMSDRVHFSTTGHARGGLIRAAKGLPPKGGKPPKKHKPWHAKHMAKLRVPTLHKLGVRIGDIGGRIDAANTQYGLDERAFGLSDENATRTLRLPLSGDALESALVGVHPDDAKWVRENGPKGQPGDTVEVRDVGAIAQHVREIEALIKAKTRIRDLSLKRAGLAAQALRELTEDLKQRRIALQAIHHQMAESNKRIASIKSQLKTERAKKPKDKAGRAAKAKRIGQLTQSLEHEQRVYRHLSDDYSGGRRRAGDLEDAISGYRGIVKADGFGGSGDQGLALDIAGLQKEAIEWGKYGDIKPDLSISAASTDAERANTLAAMLETSRRQGAMNLADLRALRGVAPLVGLRMVGQFAHGTDKVKQTGLAIVHEGESIGTNPNGPFPQYGGSASPSIEVHVHGDAGPIIRGVEVMVDGKIQQAQMVQGRRTRMIGSVS